MPWKSASICPSLMLKDGDPQRWIRRHPVQGGLVTALLALVMGLVIVQVPLIVAPISVVFGLVNWFIWRPGGPAARWADRVNPR